MGRASALFLAAVLAAAAAFKLRSPGTAEAAVRRLLPANVVRAHRRLAAQSGRVVAGVELVVAAGLAAGWRAATVAAVALCAGFVVVVAVALARGAGCGCWGSLSPDRAGGAEAGRAVALLGVAVIAAARRDASASTSAAATVVMVAALAATTVAAATAGDLLLRGRLPRPKSAPARPSARDVAAWPWSSARTLRRWHNAPEVRAALEALGPAATRLEWRDAVVYVRGAGTRWAYVQGPRVQLSIVQERAAPPVASGFDFDAFAPPAPADRGRADERAVGTEAGGDDPGPPRELEAR